MVCTVFDLIYFGFLRYVSRVAEACPVTTDLILRVNVRTTYQRFETSAVLLCSLPLYATTATTTTTTTTTIILVRVLVLIIVLYSRFSILRNIYVGTASTRYCRGTTTHNDKKWLLPVLLLLLTHDRQSLTSDFAEL